MGINVNVSVETLKEFADYISKFSGYIDADCVQLQSAITTLAYTMDDDSISCIADCVRQISKILIDQKPALDRLEEKVVNYAEFVERLKAVVKK